MNDKCDWSPRNENKNNETSLDESQMMLSPISQENNNDNYNRDQSYGSYDSHDYIDEGNYIQEKVRNMCIILLYLVMIVKKI